MVSLEILKVLVKDVWICCCFCCGVIGPVNLSLLLVLHYLTVKFSKKHKLLSFWVMMINCTPILRYLNCKQSIFSLLSRSTFSMNFSSCLVFVMLNFDKSTNQVNIVFVAGTRCWITMRNLDSSAYLVDVLTKGKCTSKWLAKWSHSLQIVVCSDCVKFVKSETLKCKLCFTLLIMFILLWSYLFVGWVSVFMGRRRRRRREGHLEKWWMQLVGLW